MSASAIRTVSFKNFNDFFNPLKTGSVIYVWLIQRSTNLAKHLIASRLYDFCSLLRSQQFFGNKAFRQKPFSSCPSSCSQTDRSISVTSFIVYFSFALL